MSTSLNIPAGGYIGIFNDSLPPVVDGVSLAVENYVKWLRDKGHTPLVVSPFNPAAKNHRYPFDILTFFSLPILNRKPYRYGYPKLDPFIWRKLRHTPFRLVHAHSPFATGRLGVYVKQKQGVPLIGTFHSKYKSDLQHSLKHCSWMVPLIMKRILDFYNACDEVWIPQASVEETVREYGYRGPLTVVENGNDLCSESENGLSLRRATLRKEAGIPESALSLLFVGQHIWEKGIGIIVDALRLIRDDVDFRMNFIGAGYASSEIQKRVRDYGLADKITFHGIVHDRGALARHYAAADMFLFPSFYDNAPLVVREAAAMGCPSLLLKGSTASEVITDHENGFLTERTPEDYARALRILASDRPALEQAGMQARRTLTRSWENVLEEVIDRYESLLRRYNRKG